MARRLVVTRQFPRVRSGEVFVPEPIVEVRLGDIPDPRVIDGEVSLSILRGPPGGKLVGETTVRCPGGVATFPGLRVTVPGEYVFMAECDEANLELIPRPSAYRYYGDFALTVGQRVTIVGDGSTTGVVSEVGDDFVIVTDDSAVSQQSVVAESETVEIESPAGVATAIDWFAADGYGVDRNLPGLVCLYREVGGALVDQVGDWIPLTYTGDPLELESGLASPIGNVGVSAPSGRMWAGAGTIPFSMTDVCIMALMRIPPATSSRITIINGRNSLDQTRGGSQMIRSGSRWAPAINKWTGSVTTTITFAQLPAGFSRYALLAVELQGSTGNGAAFLNGKLFSLGNTTTGGNAWHQSGIVRLVSEIGCGTGAAFAELAIFDRRLTVEEHLEQARRCGLAR